MLIYGFSDKRPVSRDFTYVDDIIDGIELVINYRPVSCGETFNLGFGRPASVLDMVKMIEHELGLEAKIVSETCSDSQSLRSHSYQLIFIHYYTSH